MKWGHWGLWNRGALSPQSLPCIQLEYKTAKLEKRQSLSANKKYDPVKIFIETLSVIEQHLKAKHTDGAAVFYISSSQTAAQNNYSRHGGSSFTILSHNHLFHAGSLPSVAPRSPSPALYQTWNGYSAILDLAHRPKVESPCCTHLLRTVLELS